MVGLMECFRFDCFGFVLFRVEFPSFGLLLILVSVWLCVFGFWVLDLVV